MATFKLGGAVPATAIPIGGGPPKPTQQNNRVRQSAEAAARAELAPISAAQLMGRLKSWDDLQKVVKIKIPALFREELFTLKSLADFRAWYVNSAYDRMTAALAEQSAKTVEVKKLDVKVEGVTFRPQQRKAIDETIAAYDAKHDGVWIPLGTGRGKTFVAGGIIEYFRSRGMLQNDNMLFPPVFFFTKKTVVVPTRAKLEDYFHFKCDTNAVPKFGADIRIMPYQSLGTKQFEPFFRKERIEMFGQGVEVDVWAPREKLVIIVLDECHELKKMKSKRTKRVMGIARAARARGARVFWVFMSATNATTLDDTRLFNYVTGLVDDTNATSFLQNFVSNVRGANTGSKIKAQMDRYIKHIGPKYVRPPNDPLPYKVKTTAEIIDFPSPEAEEFYRRAEIDYIESIEAIGGVVKNLDMAKFSLFRSAAEYVKCDYYANKAYNEVQSGRSAIVVVEFKRSLLKVLAILGKLGVPRSRISIVKGPDEIITQDQVYNDRDYAALLKRQDEEVKAYQDLNDGQPPDDPWFFLSKKEKTKVRKTKTYNQNMVRTGMSRYEQIEQTKWLLNMELGTQTDAARHEEVQRFLRNDTHFLLMTFSAGGTGIDADDRIPAEQGGRPRTTLSTVCYWAEQWLQALGRDARLTTLTDPHHIIAMFRRSIESEHVGPTLIKRLDSMSAMTGAGGDLEGMLAAAIAKSGKTTDFADIQTTTATSDDATLDDGAPADDEDDDDDDE
jgi:hypothetical protein